MTSAGSSSENQAEPTVLVVEDEVLTRVAIADYLRERGYRVIEAGSGDEAAAMLKAHIPVDVVFTDVSMPGTLDGLGLAQWLRRERPSVRVIVTSGVTRTAKEAEDLGAHGPIMEKPYDHGEVDSRIRTLLASP